MNRINLIVESVLIEEGLETEQKKQNPLIGVAGKGLLGAAGGAYLGASFGAYEHDMDRNGYVQDQMNQNGDMQQLADAGQRSAELMNNGEYGKAIGNGIDAIGQGIRQGNEYGAQYDEDHSRMESMLNRVGPGAAIGAAGMAMYGAGKGIYDNRRAAKQNTAKKAE